MLGHSAGLRRPGHCSPRRPLSCSSVMSDSFLPLNLCVCRIPCLECSPTRAVHGCTQPPPVQRSPRPAESTTPTSLSVMLSPHWNTQHLPVMRAGRLSQPQSPRKPAALVSAAPLMLVLSSLSLPLSVRLLDLRTGAQTSSSGAVASELEARESMVSTWTHTAHLHSPSHSFIRFPIPSFTHALSHPVCWEFSCRSHAPG